MARVNYKFLLVIALLAVVLIRIPALFSRTIHIDEGMGIRASELVLSGDYHYSPYNGHGPTLFLLGALVRKFAGTNVVFFRLIPTLCALLAILLLWLVFKLEINFIGQMVLILGLGFSSAFVFYGAYFIHEMLFILLTILAILSIERWIKTQKGIWLAFFAVFLSLMYMTKETALFTYAAWAAAGFFTFVFSKKRREILKLFSFKNAAYLFFGFFVSAILYFLLFGKSLDLFISPYLWLINRGLVIFVRPWYYFLNLLFLYETFLLLLTGFCCFYITIKKQWDAKKVFFFLWFVFIFIFYSAIPYKTPWLIPNIILPLGLFAAFGISSIWQKEKGNKILLFLIIIVLFVTSFINMFYDNFVHPDRTLSSDYAFLQGGKGLQEFIATLDGVSKIIPQKPMTIQILDSSNDELLYVLTEKYDRFYGSFKQDVPVYISYLFSDIVMKNILLHSGYEYIAIKFNYFTPDREIDLFLRKDIFDIYSRSANFIKPQTVYPDGTMRYN